MEHSACRPAGADDNGPAAGRLKAGCPKGHDEPFGVGVVPYQPIAIGDDGVDGTNGPRRAGQVIEIVHDCTAMSVHGSRPHGVTYSLADFGQGKGLYEIVKSLAS